MERRFYPRVPAQLSAIVFSPDGHAINVVAHDLSVAGLGFRCTTSERNSLTPGGVTLKDGHPIELLISFRLNEDSKEAFEIKAHCMVMYSRRLSQARCQLGMRFVDLTDSGRQRLSEFVAARVKR
ncbi:MAG: PilZ domain-containing protein [Pseudomonadota bacterium]